MPRNIHSAHSIQEPVPFEDVDFKKGTFHLPIRMKDGITLIPGPRGTQLHSGILPLLKGKYTCKNGTPKDTRPKIVFATRYRKVEVSAKYIKQLDEETWEADSIVEVQVSPNSTLWTRVIRIFPFEKRLEFPTFVVFKRGNYTLGTTSGELNFSRKPVFLGQVEKNVLRSILISD